MVWFFERESKKLRLRNEGNDRGEVVNISAGKKLSFIDILLGCQTLVSLNLENFDDEGSEVTRSMSPLPKKDGVASRTKFVARWNSLVCSPPPQSPSDSEVSSESESACTTDSHAESTTDSTDDSGFDGVAESKKTSCIGLSGVHDKIMKDHFIGKIDVHVKNLIPPHPSRAVRVINHDHVSFLTDSFVSNPIGQIVTLVGMVGPEDDTSHLDREGGSKVEVLGGNHTREALQTLHARGTLDRETVQDLQVLVEVDNNTKEVSSEDEIAQSDDNEQYKEKYFTLKEDHEKILLEHAQLLTKYQQVQKQLDEIKAGKEENRGLKRPNDSNEADSQLSKLDCSRSPIVDSPVSIPNLSRMHHLIFLALENCSDFFTSPPFLLPKGTFVWAFHGGKFHWNEPDNCVLLQDMKQKWQFYLHQNVGTTKDAADFAIVLIVGMMHERLPMRIPFTIVSGDMRFLEVECQMKTEQGRAIVVDPHIRTTNFDDADDGVKWNKEDPPSGKARHVEQYREADESEDDADDGVKWNKEDPPSGKARHVEQYREADESEDFIDIQSKSKGKKGNFTPSDLMLPGSSHNVASTRSEEADSQLSKLDCSKSPIVDIRVSTPNLSRMRLLIFLDLDNYSCFFTHPPFSLPDETFVWAFYGGKVPWRHPRKCVLLQNMKQRQQFYLHQRCGTTKDATDYAIVLIVGMMHERLPKEIPFKIVSGDKGFLEVKRQIKTELRTVDVVDPHKTLEVERQMKTEQ